MSNLRPFRRRLAVTRKAIGKKRQAAATLRWRRTRGRYPFGPPSLATVRRQLKALEAAGLAERSVRRTGKPGRPSHVWRLTEAGKRHPDGRTPGEAVVDERVTEILRRAHGKPLTEDQIIGRYEANMAKAQEAQREIAEKAT